MVERVLKPCAGLKVWPATAPPRSEEARTRTAPHNHSMRGPAPHRNILYLGRARTAPHYEKCRPALRPAIMGGGGGGTQSDIRY